MRILNIFLIFWIKVLFKILITKFLRHKYWFISYSMNTALILQLHQFMIIFGLNMGKLYELNWLLKENCWPPYRSGQIYLPFFWNMEKPPFPLNPPSSKISRFHQISYLYCSILYHLGEVFQYLSKLA